MSQQCIQFIKYRFAQSGGNVFNVTTNNSAHTVIGGNGVFGRLFHSRIHFRIGCPQRIFFNKIQIYPFPADSGNGFSPRPDHNAVFFQQIFGSNSTCCHTGRCFTAGRTAAAAIIPDTIFFPIAVICMTGPE